MNGLLYYMRHLRFDVVVDCLVGHFTTPLYEVRVRGRPQELLHQTRYLLRYFLIYDLVGDVRRHVPRRHLRLHLPHGRHSLIQDRRQGVVPNPAPQVLDRLIDYTVYDARQVRLQCLGELGSRACGPALARGGQGLGVRRAQHREVLGLPN